MNRNRRQPIVTPLMNRSVLIALGIFGALCLYLLTGLVGCGKRAAAKPEGEALGRPLMTVRVREMTAEEVAREVVMAGKTRPSRSVDLKAETAGKIIAVADLRGRPIRAGELIAAIELNDREQRLAQAEAALEQARLEHESVVRLQEQGLRSPAQVAEALARLRGAEQFLRAIEVDIRNTRLVAPFDGVLQHRWVEVGDFVGVGDPVARILDLDPLVIEGQATEFQVAYLLPGESGRAELSDGRTVAGIIRYVAAEADPRTRTFTVELEVPNPGGAIAAGLTAQLAVATEHVPAHRVSPALISIADDGRFGLKIVDESDQVRFIEADVVKADPANLWLGGLPRSMRLITLGQGFVQPGERVIAVPEQGGWR